MYCFYNNICLQRVRSAQPVWDIEVRKTWCATQKVDKRSSKRICILRAYPSILLTAG